MDNFALLAFSAYVHNLADCILIALKDGETDAALEIADELCNDAACIIARLQLQTELADPERYNLSSLSVDTTARSISELRYYEDAE